MTAAGTALLGEARRLLAQANTLAGTAQRAARGERGVLRAGVIGAAMFSQARDMQAHMSAAMPDVRLVWHSLSSSEQIEAIKDGRLDLGLINTPVQESGLVIHRTVREPFVAVVPAKHRLAGRTSIALHELKDEVFVFGARHFSPTYYDRFISACNAAGFSPNVDHQAQSIFAYVSLVAIGAGVSLVPASIAKAGISGVKYLRLKGTAPSAETSMVWSTSNRSPVLRRALALLKK
jgi:DNA-binding transcriptional LysR family regulator